LRGRKIEIAHGVLEEISSLPFEALQLNGEPAVCFFTHLSPLHLTSYSTVLDRVKYVSIDTLISSQVEKLRYICAVLLEIIQQQQQGPNTSDLVSDRAKWHFTELLDVISRLDSRVSARLVETYIPGGT
jgi:hypothetical protein